MPIICNDLKIRLTAEDVLKGQGIDPKRAKDRLYETAATVIATAEALARPEAVYTAVRITAFEHLTVRFEGGSFEGTLVQKAMAGAELIYIAICTIGDLLEKKVDELIRADPVAAIALDGAGISALRQVSQAVADLISKEACRQDLSLGMHTQPGLEGWPLEQQRQIFSLLPGHKIGVRLTESCLMIPRKSVSFVIPCGKELNDSLSPCDLCSKKSHCEWRIEKQAV